MERLKMSEKIKLPDLNQEEIDWCMQQAKEIVSRGKRQVLELNEDHDSKLLNDWHSLGADYAVAKFLGVEKPNGKNAFRGPDIGKYIQVKWHSYSRDLLVYIPQDKENKQADDPLWYLKDKKIPDPRQFVYVLVHGKAFHDFHLCGWIGGAALCKGWGMDYEALKFMTTQLKPNYPHNWIMKAEDLNHDYEMLKYFAHLT